MPAIHLASKKEFHNCKSLILCMPLISMNKIDIKTMRSITCRTLIIMEIKNKDEIEDNEMILLCREIPDEKEWFPKSKNEKSGFHKIKRLMEENKDDVYTRHRSKFITKLRDYVYTEEENVKKKIKNSSSIGGSTDSDTNLSLGEKIENKQIFEDVNEIKNDEDKTDIFNQSEVQIHNDEDY